MLTESLYSKQLLHRVEVRVLHRINWCYPQVLIVDKHLSEKVQRLLAHEALVILVDEFLQVLGRVRFQNLCDG